MTNDACAWYCLIKIDLIGILLFVLYSVLSINAYNFAALKTYQRPCKDTGVHFKTIYRWNMKVSPDPAPSYVTWVEM